MAQYQITRVRKPDRYNTHEHITHLEIDNVLYSLEDVIRFIEVGKNEFFVRSGQNIAWVGVVHPNDGRVVHLRTYADNVWTDNLLSLPPC